MKNFSKIKKSTLILLSGCILIVIVSSLMRISSNTKIINEVIKFGECRVNRSVPFEIKSDKELILNVEAQAESGKFTFKIVSPDKKTVYEKSGNNIKEQAKIEVYKGVWKWEVKCYGENDEKSSAKNGSYSIIGKLQNR